jgi:YesN/AraC family two-component response regulator
MQKIRVLVVDDHTIVRDGICALLNLAADMQVVGEAADGREALDKVREKPPGGFGRSSPPPRCWP